ncbi:MAG: hypothetical protein ACM3NQ_23685, partial [Bacteroidales bacterium]
TMLTIILAMLLGQSASIASPQAVDVSTLQVSAPVLVAEIDTGKVQGEPVGLAWNADGALYLRVVQADAFGNQKTSHYLIATKSLPSALQPTDAVPAWAASYWVMKAQLFSPKDPSFRVDVDQRAQRARTTNVANAGDLAGMSSAALPPVGGEGASSATTMDAANKSYQSTVTTMRVKGQVVGEWENVAPQPGMRFGWSPATAPITALAYAAQNKRLAVIDAQGHKQEIAATSNVLLPAWSTDGKRIAFLQKKDKKHYAVMAVDIQ